MARCLKCGSALKDDARFCHACGAKVDAHPPLIAKSTYNAWTERPRHKDPLTREDSLFIYAIVGGVLGYLFGFVLCYSVIPNGEMLVFPVGVFGAIGFGFLGGMAGKYVLYMNPISLPAVVVYKLCVWHFSPKQETRRVNRDLAKFDEKISRKVMYAILNRGGELTDEEVAALQAELSSLVRKASLLGLEIEKDVRAHIGNASKDILDYHVKYVQRSGIIEIPVGAKKLGVSEFQLTNILSYLLKSGLIQGHFVSNKRTFQTKEYISSYLRKKLSTD